MKQDEKIQYHSTRAMQELDMALASDSLPAARVHLRLASMHMDQARNRLVPADGTLLLAE
jgi:hypothetical protein